MKSKQDRQRAAKLRKKKGPLTLEQKLWLASYDGTKSKSAAQRRPTTKVTLPGKPATSPTTPTVAGEQLAWGPPTATAARPTIQATVPPVGSIDPSAHTWTPTMPEAPADAEPAPAGTPEQPQVGTPLVGDAPPSSGAAPLGGDPHAAQQFAGIVMFITQVGLMNALELSADMPIPAELRAFATSENLTAYLKFVGESAERVAIKYNFKGIPLADEAIVAASVVGSLFAWRVNMKRKQAIAKATPANANARQVEQHVEVPPPPQPTVGVNALWDQQR